MWSEGVEEDAGGEGSHRVHLAQVGLQHLAVPGVQVVSARTTECRSPGQLVIHHPTGQHLRGLDRLRRAVPQQLRRAGVRCVEVRM